MDQTPEAVIAGIIRDTFAAIGWTPARAPDWDAFRAPFRPDALLVPSARPAAPTGLDAFVERMQGLHRSGRLSAFVETITRIEVQAAGAVATAQAAYTVEANGAPDGGGVNAFLLVEDGGAWRIASLAWTAAA